VKTGEMTMVRVAVVAFALALCAPAMAQTDDYSQRWQERLQQQMELDRIRDEQYHMRREIEQQRIDMQNERERSRVEQLKRDDWRRNIER
jgi:exoribonuclease R